MNWSPNRSGIIMYILVLMSCMASNTLNAQQKALMLDSSYSGLTWEEFIDKAEESFKINFYFDEEQTRDIQIGKIEETTELFIYLKKHLKAQGLELAIDRQSNFFIIQGNAITTTLSRDIYPRIVMEEELREGPKTEQEAFIETKKEHLAQVLVVGDQLKGLKSKKANLSGYLFDQRDSSALYGATILIEELGVGTASDENGFFELRINKGEYTFILSEINHKDQKLRLKLLSTGSADFYMEEESVTLEGVIVTSDRFDRVQNTKMGFEQLSTKSVKEIPLVLGEKDILKVVTLLPGIQSVGEGSAGFNVRGSPADQNLFYIDNVPVYNTSHLFGFFSVFNSDAISKFSLSKSNIPARFGGRLASIIDIEAKEGDKEQFKLRGSISPITGSVLFEGPFKKEKSSFMLGLRSTYSNWILRLIENPDFNQSSVFFGDAIAKLDFRVDPKNKIQAFAYYSLDNIDFAKSTRFKTGNEGASVSWKRFFNEKNNLNLSLIYSKYALESENYEVAYEAYRQNNVLAHKEAKLDFIFRPSSRHNISFGANSILYDIDRGDFAPVGEESIIVFRNLGKERSLESGIYVSEEWSPSAEFSLIGGLRYNWYANLGPQSVYIYKDQSLKEEANIIDTLQFGKNDVIKQYGGLDYRLAARYRFNPQWSIKASYNRLHQYIFLLSNTIALAPSDKWKLTDYHIDPMVGDQISMGLYTYLFNKQIEFSVEGYYKKVNRLVEYRDGADLLINEVPEWDVLQGKLDAYGLELMLKKSNGRLNGWVNYTYSKAKVLVDGPLNGEQINFGEPYPANHDKPHALNLVANYKFYRRVSLSANLVYASGKPITYPSTVYYQGGIQLVNFTTRNKYRVPDYLRMDLSLKVEGNLKAKKFMHSVWVFSVYNLAGRNNVYNAYFKSSGGKLTGYKVSIFANPVFSVTYNFKFGNYDY